MSYAHPNPKVIFFTLLVVIASVLCTGTSGVFAQDPKLKDVLQTSEAEEEGQGRADAVSPERPVDEYNRGTPRSSYQGLLNAMDEADFERALEYLILRSVPQGKREVEGEALVMQLKTVLDRAIWVDPAALSNDPGGMQDDGLPGDRESIGRIKVDSGHIDLHLRRVGRDDGILIWKLSNATVRKIPALYNEYGYGVVGEKLSSILPGVGFMGLQLWQWLLLFGLLVAAYLVAFIPTWFLARVLRRWGGHSRDNLLRLTVGPIRLLLAVILAQSWSEFIRPGVQARAWLEGDTLLVALLVWVMIRFVEVARSFYANRLQVRGRPEAVALTTTVANGVKLFIIIMAMMVWLENLGFRATTLLAGLGIGGIAIALATQKPLENLIGAITLLISAPVRVGDFCRFGGDIGTVEEIGMRATRIRTLGRTAIYVPNSQFAHMKIENISGRDQILYETTIRLRHDTTPDQVRHILVEIRTLLSSHARVNPEPARVRFTGIGDSSLDLQLYTYIKTTDWGDYLEVIEDLNLRIMDVVSQAGTSLAFPTQTVSLEKADTVYEEGAGAAQLKTG